MATEALTIKLSGVVDAVTLAADTLATRDRLLARVNGYLLAQNSAGYKDGEGARRKRIKLCHVAYAQIARAALSVKEADGS